MRFGYLVRSLVLCLALLGVYTNAADTVTVAMAHVIYKGEKKIDTLYYADNEKEKDFKFLPAEKHRNGTYTVKFIAERLKPSAIEARRLRFGLDCTDSTKFCETYLYPSDDSLSTLKELFPDYVYQEKDQPVYEVWLSVDATGVTVLPGIPEEYIVPDPVEKVFRLLPSWSNTSAIMIIDGDSTKMVPAQSPYCGWFETTVKIVPRNAYASFKQTIGDTYIGSDGISHKPIAIEDEISLDSILNVDPSSDTVWIMAKYGFPEIYSTYPDELGDCPVKKLPVMVFDWLHGDKGDEKNTTAQVGTVSQDFGTGGCKTANAYDSKGKGYTKGMVEETLGANGVPVRAANFPSECKTTEHLDYWFLPEVAKDENGTPLKDANGKTYTNVTCRDLELVLDDEGFWLGQKDKESPEKGLFLLDDFEFLDSAKTVRNPYYDYLDGSGHTYDKNGELIDMGWHNYGYAMKIQAQFEYVPGQYFEFFGDDDVWVFINNKLVVDIGGQHKQALGTVNLDDIGKKIGKKGDTLVPGQTYPFHIFYAERHKDESNFKMRTSIDLRSDASMFLTDLSDDPALIKKEVWQIVRERALACDFSSSPETEKTERGPSDFILYGKSLPKGGLALKTLDSLYKKGIKVTNNYTMITIDLLAIEHAQSLPPGTYYVRVTLKENPDEYKDIYFTIPPYALPNLAFASVKDTNYKVIDFETQDTVYYTQLWTPLGEDPTYNVSSDTLPINMIPTEKMWAGRSYPVNIMFAEDWASSNTDIAVKITTSTENLIPCDSMGNTIDEVVIYNGHAHFFVKAIDEVVNGTLTISSEGATNKSANWTKINIAIPPVPQIETAYIFDRTGDGRADSIWIHFNKPLGGNSVLDSLKFIFGQSFDNAYKAEYNDGDSVAVVYAPKGANFGTSIFTGGPTKQYAGKLNIWYTYTDPDSKKKMIFPVEGALTDKVGPVIVAAEVEYLTDGNTSLKLSFSEGLSDSLKSVILFRFHCWNSDILDSNVAIASDIGSVPANQWKLVFPRGAETDIIPSVGDSVRIKPPSQMGQATDLLGNLSHEDNPFVRITGEQKISVSSPSIVAIDPASPSFDSTAAIVRSDSATVPKLVESDKPLTVDQVAAIYGTQGHYLSDLDMGTLVENEIAEIVKAVQSTPSYVDKKGSSTDKTHRIEDIIAMVDHGEMTIEQAKKRFDLDETIVDAYKNNLINSSNVHNYANGSDADIKAIVGAVANNTELFYKTYYYSSLGQYVNGDAGVIRCNDDIFTANGSKNCLGNTGRLYLAWNMRSASNRLASTGVYIARLELKVRVNSKIITNRTRDFLWGVRRGKVTAMDFGL